MSKDILRQRMKMLAKAVVGRAFFPILLVLLLQLASSLLFSTLTGEIAARFFPNAYVRIGGLPFYYMSVLLYLLSTVFLIPLYLGVAEYLQLLVRGKAPSVSGIFLWYSEKEKFSAAWSYFGFSLLFALATIPLSDIPSQYIMGTMNEVLADLQKQAEAGAQLGFVNQTLLHWPRLAGAVVLLVLGFLVSIRFMPMPYLFVDRPKENVFQTAVRSWCLMRGHTLEYLLFVLSFAGWFIACLFTMLLAGLYLLPYFQVSTVIFIAYIQSDAMFRAEAQGKNQAPPEESL